jgi:prepilin-type N-terminal cleavage/methylation domain-containing protein
MVNIQVKNPRIDLEEDFHRCRLPRTTSRGFTLMEVMLATLILAMVVSMVTLALSGSLRVVEATRDQGDLYYRAQVAIERISEDFESAILTDGVEFIGRPAEDTSDQEQLLVRFGSMAHLVFDPEHGQEGMGQIEYYLIPDPEDGEQMVLLRNDRLSVPQEKQEEGGKKGNSGFLLSNHLRTVKFSYFDAQGEEHDSWDTRVDPDAGIDEKKGKHRLPSAVACTLEFWLDRAQETTHTFQTSIRIPAGMIIAETK